MLNGVSKMHNSLNKFVLKYLNVFIDNVSFRRCETVYSNWFSVFLILDFVFITGLDATASFFSRYGASLKELDFSIMTFLWNEKYGHKLNSIEGKQLDFFCEPTSLKEARCLIWLLEEHRDKFPALHNALDEFFDIMGMWAEFQFIFYLVLGGKKNQWRA